MIRLMIMMITAGKIVHVRRHKVMKTQGGMELKLYSINDIVGIRLR